MIRKNKVSKPTIIPKKKGIRARTVRQLRKYKDPILIIMEINQAKTEEEKRAVRRDFIKASIGSVETIRQARIADMIDLIPIVGDISQIALVLKEKSAYKKKQITDLLVGIVPIIGDIADFLFMADTNRKIAEDKLRQRYYHSLVDSGKQDIANLYVQELQNANINFTPLSKESVFGKEESSEIQKV